MSKIDGMNGFDLAAINDAEYETEICPLCGVDIYVGMMDRHNNKDHNPEDAIVAPEIHYHVIFSVQRYVPNDVWDNKFITCRCCGINYERPIVEDEFGEKMIFDFMHNIIVDSNSEDQYLMGLCGKCDSLRPFPCPHWGDMKGNL